MSTAAGPRYTRIRVRESSDIAKLYPLLLSYAKEPSLAASVTEFVFRSHLPPHELYLGRTDRPEEFRAAEASRDITHQALLSRAIECLSLDAAARNEWIRILSWMEPELVAGREEFAATDSRPFQVTPFFRHRDIVFAHHAAALLLMLCLNIETLVYEDGSRIVKDVLRRNNYGLLREQRLQKLRHVTVMPTSDSIMGDERFYINADPLELMRLFHRLPSFVSFSIDGVGPNNDGGYRDAFPPATSDVKKIRVGHSLYGTDVIGPLIRISRGLEEFTWTTGGRCNLDGGYNMRYPKTLSKALLQHKTTLRKLDIDIDEHVTCVGEAFGPRRERDEDGLDPDIMEYEKDWSAEQLDKAHGRDEWWRKDKEISSGPLNSWELPNTRAYHDTIGSLHDFEALTHLSIGVQLLLGQSHWDHTPGRSGAVLDEAPFRLVEALPKGLEYLLIRGYTRGEFKEYDDQFDELMAKREEYLPKLKQIHGIEEFIPSAKSIDRPDDHPDDLWEPEETEDGWFEAME